MCLSLTKLSQTVLNQSLHFWVLIYVFVMWNNHLGFCQLCIYLCQALLYVYTYFSRTWYTATATGSDICHKLYTCCVFDWNLFVMLWLCMQFGNKLLVYYYLTDHYIVSDELVRLCVMYIWCILFVLYMFSQVYFMSCYSLFYVMQLHLWLSLSK